MIIRPPIKDPEMPAPEIARPIITAAEFGARAATKEPSWNTRKAPKKTYFAGEALYTCVQAI